MSAKPSISVVLIVFNGENFLAEAIDSVVNQSLEDWELVVTDDGSTDGTSDILRRYQEQLGSKMIICRHPGGQNRGMSAARNLGVAHASSDVVTFLDHDDVLEPEKLHLHLEALKRHPDANYVLSPCMRWFSWNPDLGSDEVQDLGPPGDRMLHSPGLLPKYLHHTASTPIGFTVRTEVLRGIGGFTNVFRSMYEDQVMVAKLSLTTPGVVVDQPLHQYRQHAMSCVRQTFSSGGHFALRRQFLRWLHPYLLEHRPEDHALIKQSQDQLHVLRHEQWAWRKKRLRDHWNAIRRRLGC